MSLVIRKEGIKNFGHYDSNFISRYSASDLTIAFEGDYLKLRSDRGQIIFEKDGYLYSDVTIYDDTSGGSAEPFANVEDLEQRLIDLGHPAFFEDGDISNLNIDGGNSNSF